ncbi:hypothetical protein NE236_08875 [Actinoallomurus purpureus]|uniref:hypothetical protein n=1 Tax=Actinoallomurus purpureus TaxID=478114 RepID=UPI002092F58F|nr:hypothetical protein [Actinoallomurus purpureus]MCO6005095.1 hypothetical protein [Actinoallomurus purpureus]
MNESWRTTTPAARAGVPLLVVAVVYGVAQLVGATAHMRLGWDETVYISQVSPRVPAAFFSAPRARGITLPAAPIVAATPSLTALRWYMTVLSSLGLVVAYWPWARLLRPVTAGLAALLLASLWMVRFYGNEVMPNLYVAYGAVAAAGWFAHAANSGPDTPHRALGIPPRRACAWLGVAVACTALLRPGDAVWLVLPLTGAAVIVGRNRLGLLAAMALGLTAGLLPWAAEAYARFGDPLRRLRDSSRVEGGLGWHPEGVAMNLRALNDSILCRPCGTAISHVPTLALWWPALPPLVVAGLVLAARRGRLRLLVPPAACGAVLAAAYLLFVGYAAPRFLIPAYALLALPVAELATGLVVLARGRWRVVAAGGVAAALVVLAAGQQIVLTRRSAVEDRSRRDYSWLAAGLRDLGLRPPCTLSGDRAQPLAFYAGCRSVEVTGNNAATSVAGLLLAARTTRFADLRRTGARPRYARGWRRYVLITPAQWRWRVYVPPGTVYAPHG